MATRLRYCRWQAWAGWVGTGLISFIGLIVSCVGPFVAGRAFLAVFGLSVVGFLGPELWEAVRAVACRPRTWLFVGGVREVLCLDRV